MKRLSSLLFICLFSLNSWAQQPNILSVDKYSGPMGARVILSGNGFGTDPDDIKVFFGSAPARIEAVSDQLLEVSVPEGASYDNISVSRISSGLTAYSSAQFLLSFGGDMGVAGSDVAPQADFDAETGLYDICLCDFSGDGKPDVATATPGFNSISILTNTGSIGAPAFTKSNFLINARTLHVTCGDLNGDGRPDIVASENDGNRVFVFRNTGASFSAQAVTLTGRKVKQVTIADLDADGKPEVIVSDQGSNVITVLRNESTTSNIVFSSNMTTLSMPGAMSSDAIEVRDLDGDDMPEVIASQFNVTTDIYVFRNQGIPGSIGFAAPVVLAAGGTVINLRATDLDLDGKPDIVATRLLNGDIQVFRNESAGQALTFSTPMTVAAASRPWGIEVGDFDGDSRPDLVLASIDPASKSLTILNNSSTQGSITFQPALNIPVTYINRHPHLVDVDTDGKPDLVFASVDDNSLNVPASKISVLRNTSCFIPTVTPAGPVSICEGFELELASSQGGGVTWQWTLDGGNLPGETNNTLAADASGNYAVTATSEGGNCQETSNAVTVTVSTPGTNLTGTPSATSNTPVCTGNELDLSINDVGADEYRWTGPGGFTATGLNVSRDIDNPENAGLYIVELILGTCVAATDTISVEVTTIPAFEVVHDGSGVFCEGSEKILSLSPSPAAGFTVAWHEEVAGEISGESGSSVTITTAGIYYAVITPAAAGCSAIETPHEEVQTAQPPAADFTSPANGMCAGQEIQFTNTSTADGNFQASFNWEFGDGNTSTEENPTHVFTAEGSYDVKLSVSYDGLCPDETTATIEIAPTPQLAITNGNNRFAVCPNDTLHLTATGDDITSYTWNTGEETQVIIVDAPGEYSVDIVTASGCAASTSVSITELSAPTVTASANPPQINAGETSQLSASGLESYQWQPGETLSDPTISNPLASPVTTTTYTVEGEDANGCFGSVSVEVVVIGSSVFDRLVPHLYFSPNGDEHNNVWVVENIDEFPGCSLTIYNDKGARVFHAKPYLNDWDGTFKGSPLPEGVYYYAIRCDGEGAVKTGSITLLK